MVEFVRTITDILVTRRSIRNFNIPPPPGGKPRAFDCASCPGRGEFERCVGRVGNLNQIYLLFSQYAREFFRFLQGLTDLQDRISPLLVNNSFERHLSLWEACEVLYWRRNLALGRGNSVLIGGAFVRLFCPRGEGIWTSQSSKVQMPGGGGCWTFELIGALLSAHY